MKLIVDMETLTKIMLALRLHEIMNDDEVYEFRRSPQFAVVTEAVENGWPFLIRRKPDGCFDVFSQKVAAA